MCLGSSLLQAADHVQGSEFAGLTRKVLTAVAMCYYCALVDFTTVFFANVYCCGFASSKVIGALEINIGLLSFLGNSENCISTY